MKKFNTILAMAATVAAFASCNKENFSEAASQPEISQNTLSITVGNESKTLLRMGTQVNWAKTDSLKVFDADTGFVFKTTSSDVATALFTCDNYTGGTPLVAVHCNGAKIAKNTYDGTSITSYLNPAQTIYHKASYSKEAALAVGEVSKVGEDYVVQSMKQCFALLRFSLLDTAVVSVTVKGNNGETLAGGVKVNCSSIESGNDFWTTDATVGSAAGQIDLKVTGSGCKVRNNGIFADTTFYYVSILPQTLAKGVTFVMTREDGKTATREITSPITLNRAKIKGLAHPVDSGLVYKVEKAEKIVLDCTNAANFRYNNGTKDVAFPTSDHGKNFVTGDFWLVGQGNYIFNGSVKNWGNTLNAASGSLVKLPSISGYTLTEVNVTYSKASADRTYRISDGENTLFKCTRNSSTTGETKMDLTGTPLNPPTHPERYLSSSGEMCVKFTLTYTLTE